MAKHEINLGASKTDSDDEISRPIWMKELAEEHPSFAEKPLAEIALPGSHDSASHKINGSSQLSPGCESWAKTLSSIVGSSVVQTHYASWTKCQTYDVATQLLNGIRYLDLRVCTVGGELWVCHAQLSVLLSTVLDEVVQFVRSIGTQEIILLDFQQLHDFSRETHTQLCSMVQSTLGALICPRSGHTCQVTLSELWKTEERILVFHSDEVEPSKHKWLWWRREYLNSPWHNTPDCAVLIERMTAQWCQWRDAGAPQQFTVTQAQCTPNTKLVSKNLLTSKSSTQIKSILDLAAVTHLPVCEWIKKRQEMTIAEGRWSGKI